MRKPMPNAEEKVKRRDMREAAADIAMKERHEREWLKRANMERLKAERLARSRSTKDE